MIHVANYSGHRFAGWRRLTVDREPPHDAGDVAYETNSGERTARYVVGRRSGLADRVVDVWLELEPGEVASLDLSRSMPRLFPVGGVPKNPEEFFGQPKIAGTPMRVVSVEPHAAGYDVHLLGSVGGMLHIHVWLHWWPDWPAIAQGEIVVCASNSGVPDMAATVPPRFSFDFGAADVLVPGATGPNLLPSGEYIGDGQARSFPVTLVWREHLADSSEWASAGAAASLAICANGISELWPGGNPARLSGSALEWSRRHWSRAVADLHTWNAQLGIVPNGTQTGAEEDQVFVGAECMNGVPSLGAETIRYLVALGGSRRPCHHLEADGSLLSLTDHPDLAMWHGRAHWHRGVSPDQLGKPREITLLDTHGWLGPWREHWLCNTLAIASRLTGSPALQWQLEAQARVFLFQETVDPRFSTSGPDAVRSMGWAGLVALHLWRCLDDRDLAEQVRERWRQRVTQVYIPAYAGKDVWTWTDDARLSAETGRPINVLAYQQMQGAGLLDYACRHIGPDEGRELALRGCKAMLDRCYSKAGGRWQFWELISFDPQTGIEGPLVEGAGAHRTGWFDHTWALPGIACVLAHEPGNERAREVWAQNVLNGGKWVPPGAVQ